MLALRLIGFAGVTGLRGQLFPIFRRLCLVPFQAFQPFGETLDLLLEVTKRREIRQNCANSLVNRGLPLFQCGAKPLALFALGHVLFLS